MWWVLGAADGDILRISPQGKLDYDKFNFIDYSGNKYCKWWNYGYDSYIAKSDKDYSDVYIEDLKCIAAYQGYSPEDIDTMLESGISPDEIEEYLYCWEWGDWHMNFLKAALVIMSLILQICNADDE